VNLNHPFICFWSLLRFCWISFFVSFSYFSSLFMLLQWWSCVEGLCVEMWESQMPNSRDGR
jgi:hypothetical protein